MAHKVGGFINWSELGQKKVEDSAFLEISPPLLFSSFLNVALLFHPKVNGKIYNILDIIHLLKEIYEELIKDILSWVHHNLLAWKLGQD